ncbi:hypothetical protein K437DRAFT_257574 [Tilletiaria anomala UBC 951]|uniref:Transmembrane protein 188 n=1 Tax=Tilletiaria anomala (strain ATCC 24038 / CBS 436.72 / UBC 951) TaxID=1037660 RepID=A0A066VXC2_TILAU|nr:uncharacterized protein K437DRAFT_257574 [Tilletiaria anomala UBC 951]KDN43200.1 hypothetical protein K437DRAFT_257574 [Tilletiaria anomala UBC 951]
MTWRSGAAAGGRATTGGTAGRNGHLVESSVPLADAQTFRDLLIFEERLKQSATRLQKRKKKYETLLALSCGAIAFLSYHVAIDKPEILIFHRINIALLLFFCTNVFLFFASGMYADRIVAANKFVPQANRSLRNFNMYLNTRTTPRRGIFARIFLPFLKPPLARRSNPPSRSGSPHTSPSKELFGLVLDGSSNNSSSEKRQPLAPQQSDRPVTHSITPSLGAKNGRNLSQASSIARRNAISAIPPAANPRGELIFNSKVSPAFREGYERYRSAFERRRSEKLEAKRRSGWRWWLYTGAGWGWWVKEIWKPPEAEPHSHSHLHAHGHHAQGHHAHAHGHGHSDEPYQPSRRTRVTSGVLSHGSTQGGTHARTTRGRSGTAGSTASNASLPEGIGGSALAECNGNRGIDQSGIVSNSNIPQMTPSRRRRAGPDSATRHSKRLDSLSNSGPSAQSSSTYPEGSRASAALQRSTGPTRHTYETMTSVIIPSAPIGTRSRRSKEASSAASGTAAGDRSERGRDATPSPVAASYAGGTPLSLSPTPSISERSIRRDGDGVGEGGGCSDGGDAAADTDAAAVVAMAEYRSDLVGTLREPEPEPEAHAADVDESPPMSNASSPATLRSPAGAPSATEDASVSQATESFAERGWVNVVTAQRLA